MASSDEMAPDFNTKTCKQLRALLTSRKVKHKDLKLKAQLVATADESEARKRKAEEELEREEAKKRKIEYDALLAQVQERGLKLEGTTLQALRDILQHDNKRKHKDEIWRGLFKRDFKADPARKSFTNLPREIRDICYGYVFDNTVLTNETSSIGYESKHDRFKV